MSPEQRRGRVTKGPPDNRSQTPTRSSVIWRPLTSPSTSCGFFLKTAYYPWTRRSFKEWQASFWCREQLLMKTPVVAMHKNRFYSAPHFLVCNSENGLSLSEKHCLFSIHIFQHLDHQQDTALGTMKRLSMHPGGQGMFSALNPMILPSSSQP